MEALILCTLKVKISAEGKSQEVRNMNQMILLKTGSDKGKHLILQDDHTAELHSNIS